MNSFQLYLICYHVIISRFIINHREVSLATEKCLKDIYKEIEMFFDTLHYEVEVKIMEILIEKCNYEDEQIKLTAFEWILIFIPSS